MQVLSSKAEMRAWSQQARAAGRRIALVPTMGYLHEGHLSLVARARPLAEALVVSIYVNPTQFAPHEDFDVYPRDLGGDLGRLAAHGVDAVFAPPDLYDRGPGGAQTRVLVSELQRPLCGVSRPHFFGGVATVVAKLFHLVSPDVAVFGRKDYQQLRVIDRMVRDLDFPVEVVAAPIVREPDGLAMSSRNALLAPEARRAAAAIPQALRAAQQRAAAGAIDAAALRAEVQAALAAAGGRPDYVEVVDPDTLAPLEALAGPAVLAVAAWFGGVRLIDNVDLTPPPASG